MAKNNTPLPQHHNSEVLIFKLSTVNRTVNSFQQSHTHI